MDEKIRVNNLLDSIRRDAIRKVQGKEVTEQVYSSILEIVKLARAAGKGGLLELEETMENDMKNEKSGLDNITILPMGIEYVVDGMDSEILAEILTSKYWVKNPQEMEALAYYICIQGIFMIQESLPVYHLEALLTALLPEKCIAEYEKRKEDKMPEQASKTLADALLEKELGLPRRSTIIRNALEEKISQVTESVIKCSMQRLGDDAWNAFVLRGLSKDGKAKLLSCMTTIHRNAVLETEACMGPIRQIDIEDAMVKFLEYIEETEGERAAV